MEPFDNYGMPQERPAAESPMNGQTNPPFFPATPPAEAGPAPARRGMFGRVGKPRRTLIAGVTVAALAATGGVALAAATSNPTPTPGAPGAAAMMHGRGGPVHGEFTVSDGKGGYQTELMQRGTVQSFAGGTLTVKSADGYTHSYSTDSTTVFGRGKGMRGGKWMGGPMNRMKPGMMPNGTNMPNGTGTTNGTAVPNNGGGSTDSIAPNTALPQNNSVMPSSTTPNLTVGENVVVIAMHSGSTDHAQRVMPMRQMNPNGKQFNGNGNGKFGRRHGFPGMMGGQLPGGPNGMPQMNPGNGQTGNGPMGGGQLGNVPMDGGQMNGGPVNLPNGAPATSSSPASTPQSSADATAQPVDPAGTTNG